MTREEYVKWLEQQTCEDAVSREAAIDAAINGADDWDGGYNPTREEYIKKAINALPSVNPQQRVGHWIQTEEKDDAEPCILWECSCCHKEFRGVVHKVSNYCPKCGCRMVEPQERNDEE